jgi:hypothetical protein
LFWTSMLDIITTNLFFFDAWVLGKNMILMITFKVEETEVTESIETITEFFHLFNFELKLQWVQTLFK